MTKNCLCPEERGLESIRDHRAAEERRDTEGHPRGKEKQAQIEPRVTTRGEMAREWNTEASPEDKSNDAQRHTQVYSPCKVRIQSGFCLSE